MQRMYPLLVLLLVAGLVGCSEQGMLAEPEPLSAVNGTSTGFYATNGALMDFSSEFCDDLELPAPQSGTGELRFQFCNTFGNPGFPLRAFVTVKSFLPYSHRVEGWSNTTACWVKNQFNWTGFAVGKEQSDEEYDSACEPTSGGTLKNHTTYLVTVESENSDGGGDGELGPNRQAATSNVIRDRFFFRFITGPSSGNENNTPDIFAVWKDNEFLNISEPAHFSGYYFPSESDWNAKMPEEDELRFWQGPFKANGLTVVDIDTPLSPFQDPKPFAATPYTLDWTPFESMKGIVPGYTTTGKHLKVLGRIKPGTTRTIEVFEAI
ncbi:MAG: hypothetical protein KTR29_21060, partial [Rhodothermaceae bacterium]|nr:hypothetical protein [Rhodothermaceae bacterium]